MDYQSEIISDSMILEVEDQTPDDLDVTNMLSSLTLSPARKPHSVIFQAIPKIHPAVVLFIPLRTTLVVQMQSSPRRVCLDGRERKQTLAVFTRQILYVHIAPPQRTKMGPQRRLRIYVGYATSSIIRYIEPLTGDLFTARFVDCHFDEAVFPKLGGVKKNQEKNVTWCEPSLYKRVTKPHIPAVNAPTRVEIPNKQADDNIAQESQKRLKHGRPIGSKDEHPRKRKGTEKNYGHDENVLDETQDIKTSPKEEMNDINKEMSINYSQTHIVWDRNEIGDIDEIFSYSVARDIMNGDDDPELKSVIDCQSRPNWDKWKDAMQAKLNSLNE
ncbi:hypothetical protein Tco_0270231 [Tanacetum coccineum]